LCGVEDETAAYKVSRFTFYNSSLDIGYEMMMFIEKHRRDTSWHADEFQGEGPASFIADVAAGPGLIQFVHGNNA
jgi:hypothetical protein